MPLGVPQGESHTVPVLMYHDIADAPTAHAFRRFVVPPALFAEHLEALREAGYTTGRVSDLPSCSFAGCITGSRDCKGLCEKVQRDRQTSCFCRRCV